MRRFLPLLCGCLLTAGLWLHAAAAAQTDAPAGTWRDVNVNAAIVGSPARAPDGTIETTSLVVGGLTFRGSLVLSSDDPAFGGFSGLRLSADGTRLTAISDRAQWFEADIRYDRQGAIADLGNARMATLMRYNGEVLRGAAGDAEGLALTADGGALVSFERYHRIDHYIPDGDGRLVYRQRGLHNRIATGLEANGSLEALLLLRDGRVLTIAENSAPPADLSDSAGRLITGGERPGWISGPENWFAGGDDWRPLAYQPADGFSVTDLAQTPEGDMIYVLERVYSPGLGVRARIARLPLAAIEPGVVLAGEEVARLTMLHGIDNLEAMELRRSGDGRLLVYLMSDDNFNLVQRTVLMSWEVTG